MNPTRKRLVFAGTPEFAARCLEALIRQGGHDIVGVYTQPDRRAGRGRRPRPSAVKELALGHGLELYQPPGLRDTETREVLAALRPDLMIVVAYGLLLPQAVLDIPRRGCVNVHASLLPRWRGAAPIERALQAGDRETGISLMRMEIGLDTGPVLSQRSMPIEDHDTAASLHRRLAALGAETLLENLDDILADRCPARPQDEALATYADKISKQEAAIDWSRSAIEIGRDIRAFNPRPIAHTRLQGQDMRIWEARPLSAECRTPPGTVIACTTAGIDVAAADGVVRITRLQLPGRKPVAVRDFLNAHPDFFSAR